MGNMKQFFDLSSPVKRFRLIAFIEALTWAALLIAMVFKHGFGYDSAIRVPGMAHGAAFVIFGLLALTTALTLAWGWKVTALALISSVPPFGTVVFERWASRKGHLDEPSDEPAVGDPAVVGAASAD